MTRRRAAAWLAAALLAATTACGPDRGGSGLPPGATFATGTTAGDATGPSDPTADPTTTTPLAEIELSPDTVSFTRVTAALAKPVDLATRDGDPTLYVVEQGGTVVPVTIDTAGEAQVGTPVLDISDMVSTGNEQGLLAVEFHPSEPLAYANYTDLDGHTKVVEFEFDDSTGTAVFDVGSRRELLTVQQPYPNHNGGDLIFDADGMLLIALGDGGAGGDPDRVSLDMGSMLGKILRIDPLPGSGAPYGVPPDNPFVDTAGALPEIWSAGLRNPWRIDIDPATGELWVADVGQGEWEEVTVVDSGRGVNFGWSAFEGSRPFNADQDGSGATPPAFEYQHGDDGCSVSGGAVLQPGGSDGWFVFSDYCSGRVWAMRRGAAPIRIDAMGAADAGLGNVTAVRRGSDGAVYVLLFDGLMLRLSVERP
ncbi:MAG: PQQ-dependent sugar dehydrogenase [Ilumatobacteraceae bacterium]